MDKKVDKVVYNTLFWMSISNKKIKQHIFTILFVILLGITIRYYWICFGGISHQYSWDTFFYSIESNVILEYHRMTWLLHPLSLWGLYPYSDSPAAPVYVAEISSLSGLSVENSILVFDILIVIFAAASMYLLSYKIKRSLIFSFITSFVFISAPIYTASTIWFMDERGIMVYFIPNILLIILMLINNKYQKFLYKLRLTAILLVYIFILSTTHLTFVFTYSLFIGLICFYLWKIIKKTSLGNFIIKNILNKTWNYSSILLSSLIIFLIYSLFIINNFIDLPLGFSIESYKRSAILSGEDPVTIMANIGISLSGGVGILFPFLFPLGILYSVFKKQRNLYENYTLVIFLLTVPILINRLYSRPLMVFICSIYIGFGLLFLFEKINVKRIKKYIIPSIIMSILVTSIFTEWYIYHLHLSFYKAYPIRYDYSASPYTHEFGLYQGYNFKKSIWICNDGLIAQRIQSYSGTPIMPAPLGAPINHNPVLYNLTDKSTLKIRKSTEKEFKYIVRPYISPYIWEMRNDYYEFFRYENKAIIKNITLKYSISYICEYKKISGKVAGYHSQKIYDSPLMKNANMLYYKVYENKYYCYFFLEIG